MMHLERMLSLVPVYKLVRAVPELPKFLNLLRKIEALMRFLIYCAIVGARKRC